MNMNFTWISKGLSNFSARSVLFDFTWISKGLSNFSARSRKNLEHGGSLSYLYDLGWKLTLCAILS